MALLHLLLVCQFAMLVTMGIHATLDWPTQYRSAARRRHRAGMLQFIAKVAIHHRITFTDAILECHSLFECVAGRTNAMLASVDRFIEFSF